MAQIRRGCGCASVVLAIIVIGAGIVAIVFLLPKMKEWWVKRPPPPSGAELQVHVLDVGQADSILIISPENKVVLIDAGDTGDGKKVVLDALKRYGANQIDLLIATHAHADHIGGADEVLNGINTVVRVLDSGVPPPTRASADAANAKSGARPPARPPAGSRGAVLPTTKAYGDFLEAVERKGAEFIRAEPGQRFEIGGGAVISVLAPAQPLFTKDQLRSGGNEPNANSVVVRLDYGNFSMLLTGDAEEQTEQRLINLDAALKATILKVGHHGSKYATSERFIERVRPEVAIVSTGEANRYGHPSQGVLDRLKAARVKVYRTDLQGEISIISRGGGDYEIKTAKDAKTDLWAGREAQRDDSANRGFVSYGDFGPPPREAKEKSEKKSEKSPAGGR